LVIISTSTAITQKQKFIMPKSLQAEHW